MLYQYVGIYALLQIPFANYLVNIQTVIFLVHCELYTVEGN